MIGETYNFEWSEFDEIDEENRILLNDLNP